jgi:hypothetical protein
MLLSQLLELHRKLELLVRTVVQLQLQRICTHRPPTFKPPPHSLGFTHGGVSRGARMSRTGVVHAESGFHLHGHELRG